MFDFAAIPELIRIKQWSKQVLFFVPLLSLGSKLSFSNIALELIGAFGFSLIAGFIYIVNDIVDRSADEQDESKKSRPIVTGKVTVNAAKAIGSLCFLVGVCLLIGVSKNRFGVLICCVAYVIINFGYSILHLKRHRILGISCVAAGFPIRFLLGTFILNLNLSYWAIALLSLLALAMLSGKRFQTVKRMQVASQNSKLDEEKEFWLLTLILLFAMFGASYAGFISATQTQNVWGSNYLLLSTIPVALGCVRYLEIVTHPDAFLEEDATQGVAKDRISLIIVGLYLLIMLVGRLHSGA